MKFKLFFQGPLAKWDEDFLFALCVGWDVLLSIKRTLWILGERFLGAKGMVYFPRWGAIQNPRILKITGWLDWIITRNNYSIMECDKVFLFHCSLVTQEWSIGSLPGVKTARGLLTKWWFQNDSKRLFFHVYLWLNVIWWTESMTGHLFFEILLGTWASFGCKRFLNIPILDIQNPSNTWWGPVFGTLKSRTSGGVWGFFDTDPHKVFGCLGPA